jgi:hypothetical protein
MYPAGKREVIQVIPYSKTKQIERQRQRQRQ